MCVAGYRVELTEMVCHIVVLSLTIVSLVLATVPFWSPTPPTIRQRQIFMWCDFFITFIFLMDLVVSLTITSSHISEGNVQLLMFRACCLHSLNYIMYTKKCLLCRFVTLSEIHKQIQHSRCFLKKTGLMSWH